MIRGNISFQIVCFVVCSFKLQAINGQFGSIFNSYNNIATAVPYGYYSTQYTPVVEPVYPAQYAPTISEPIVYSPQPYTQAYVVPPQSSSHSKHHRRSRKNKKKIIAHTNDSSPARNLSSSKC